jgi:2-polyprenyl-6-methoxyphenol hydroxylase-like FAD-dependent oxidoreductase
MAGGFDVIVVGARAAGAATAMLLARRGLRVLAVDRAGFPSDTLSTHQVQLPGVARLRRWGLLDRVAAAGTPPTRRLRFDAGSVVLDGRYPPHDGADAVYSPRRTVLDAILVDAARAAGAEVRERFFVEDLRWEEGRVAGIRGFERRGHPVTERAPLVVGADGKHSLVARAARARAYRERGPLSVACYTYWSGVPTAGGELYRRGGHVAAAFPTNDGLTMVYVAVPIAAFDAFRRDAAGRYLAALDACGDLGARVREGARAERLRTTPDLPNAFRVPHGPGWALVGDAGLVMDPISAQGIGNAFRDAELLAEAIEAGLGGRRPLGRALAAYRRRRDAAARPMYDFTVRQAAFGPLPPGEERLLAGLAGRPAEIDRFFGVLTGSEPIPRYLAPANLLRVLGARRLAGVLAAQARPRPRTTATPG